MSGAVAEGSAVDPSADTGAAATVQARAVVIGAVTAIVVQPAAMYAWLFAVAAWAAGTSGNWTALFSDWSVSLRGLKVFGGFAAIVMGVATPFVVVLGVPAFLALNHFGRVTWLNLVLAGAVAGTVPLAIASPEVWQVPTIAGLHGAAGGLAFFLAWRRAGGIPRPRLTAS